MKKALNIIFLGTGSDVGKSIAATAFCRILRNRGYRVAPFKAQNMSNNSFVTIEGGEIGRAQAVQAEACGLPPSVHMNPVLLKPTGDKGSQVVIHGKVHANMPARDYYAFKAALKEKVRESYHSLEQAYDVIVMEGAGSCCEVNLREYDIVNFEMALSTDAPVVIVADIDKGGVFAQIIGTLEIISKAERNLVSGFIINKFRGDPELFRTGIEYIEARTRKPVFGLVPLFTDFRIDTEDSMSLDMATGSRSARKEERTGKITVAVVRLPHISNFTDIEILESEPEVCADWITEPKNLGKYDLIIFPGSKSTINDMIWLHEQGWRGPVRAFCDKGKGLIIGLCGGFQILGKEICDPWGIEGSEKRTEGLGLLDISTEIEKTKVVRCSEGRDRLFGAKVRGYEIHMGQTLLSDRVKPFLSLETGSDGAMDTKGNIVGTYLHGLFDSGEFRKRFLGYIAERKGIPFDIMVERKDYDEEKDKNYDRLAAHFSRYVDVGRIIRIINQ